MSLLSALNVANNALTANQIGLRVTGNNIANSNTPGYIRETVSFTPAPSQQLGSLNIGLGVEVEAVLQQVDRFVEARLRGAKSDVSSGDVQSDIYAQLEATLGELGTTDLSTALTRFFGAISDVANQPESKAVRNLAVLEGGNLAQRIQRIDSQVREIRQTTDDRLVAAVGDVNRLLEEVSTLNIQILAIEGGSASSSDAVGLRDKRSLALQQLSELIDIRAVEQESGTVSVFAGGEFLVFEGVFRELTTETTSDRGQSITNVRLKDTDGPVEATAGKIAGLVQARDQILGGFIDSFESFTQTLAFEFNKVYSGGQGLTGYTEVTNEFAVTDTTAALDTAGLPFKPVNGSFQLLVTNTKTGQTETTDVPIKISGLDDDTSLQDIQTQLDGVDGISATLDQQGRLTIASNQADIEFAFASDTSGALAALGFNTFFSGSSASTLGVQQAVRDDPNRFAASQGGVGNDTQNASTLANLANVALDSQNGDSITKIYEKLVADTTQQASVSKAIAEGFRIHANTLESQHLSITGVSIDEEALKMILFQRSYQAAARLIQTVNELLEVLVSI